MVKLNAAEGLSGVLSLVLSNPHLAVLGEALPVHGLQAEAVSRQDRAVAAAVILVGRITPVDHILKCLLPHHQIVRTDADAVMAGVKLFDLRPALRVLLHQLLMQRQDEILLDSLS